MICVKSVDNWTGIVKRRTSTLARLKNSICTSIAYNEN